MAALSQDELDIIKATSLKRNAVFANKPRNRPLTEGYEEIGMSGEWEFGKYIGQMPRIEKVGGDGGWDFEVPMLLKVDVKTSKKGDVLLVERGKVKADIYVLAHFVEGDVWESETESTKARVVTLVGWAWARDVLSVEPKDTGRGIINHQMRRTNLRTMEELKGILALRGR